MLSLPMIPKIKTNLNCNVNNGIAMALRVTTKKRKIMEPGLQECILTQNYTMIFLKLDN